MTVEDTKTDEPGLPRVLSVCRRGPTTWYALPSRARSDRSDPLDSPIPLCVHDQSAPGDWGPTTTQNTFVRDSVGDAVFECGPESKMKKTSHPLQGVCACCLLGSPERCLSCSSAERPIGQPPTVLGDFWVHEATFTWLESLTLYELKAYAVRIAPPSQCLEKRRNYILLRNTLLERHILRTPATTEDAPECLY
ncbi:hypothetical protein BJV74DRAFT_795558 [Russula compacta]|nr:hypothetical protein BJV74DRAFT_795558 [Russula compacta]